MSAEILGIRQPVITQAARNQLSEYCAFRHVVKNVVRSTYALNSKGDRIHPLLSALPAIFARFQVDCDRFCQIIALRSEAPWLVARPLPSNQRCALAALG